MQATDKFRSDLDQALRRAASSAEASRLEALRSHFYSSFRNVPEGTLADLFTAFLAKWRDGETKALDWLGGVGSLLLMDYDGTAFSKEDWAEIREAVELEQGDIDLDLLTYVMTLVLDHGAL